MLEVLQTVLMILVVVEKAEDGDDQKDVGQEKFRGLFHLLPLPLLFLMVMMVLRAVMMEVMIDDDHVDGHKYDVGQEK